MFKMIEIPDRLLFVATSLLIAIGIICSYSLSEYVVVMDKFDQFHFVSRELFIGIISIFVMWVLAQINPEKWLHRIGIFMLIFGLGLIIAMPFLPSSLVSEVGGAKRWISLPGLSLAPVEFFKIGFVYFLAWSFTRKFTQHHSTLDFYEEVLRFLPYAAIYTVAVFFIAVTQNDLGQVVVLTITLATMLVFAGTSTLFFSMLVLAALLLFGAIILSSSNRIHRVMEWWQSVHSSIVTMFPQSATQVQINNEPYQISHSLNAIHNGGIFGTGIGGGTFKLGFIAEVHTDFVLSGIAEETGFIGILFVTLLFMIIAFRMTRIAGRSFSSVYNLFTIGIMILIISAFMINAYGIIGLIPIKGIAVPFLSYGGSSMLATSIGVGMVLMVSKRMSNSSFNSESHRREK